MISNTNIATTYENFWKQFFKLRNRVTKQLHQENFVHINKITSPQIHNKKPEIKIRTMMRKKNAREGWI
jgi:uncharacterized protein with HEPN domain